MICRRSSGGSEEIDIDQREEMGERELGEGERLEVGDL